MIKIFPIELKESVFKILVLYLKTDSISVICKELNKKFNMSPNFFKDLPIVIDIKKLSNINNWNNIIKLIISFNFHIIGVSGCYNNVLKNIIIKSGLLVLSEETKSFSFLNKYRFNNVSVISKNNKKTKIIDFPIRSGQKIYANNSDIIVTNNVNSGAEIIADGNVHIYGSMRGRVLAGAKGDITCQIFCMKFFAELISISGEYLLSDQISPDCIGNSVKIYIKNKKLNILKLN
ncbi:septum site-determining protein MinC [Buchnera aphidicola]|uniref:septum site-determining protein MinC n=1 Tax=Buchnera aphidicola TaxID=9 RepID=UPI0021C85487|nr:septum site-determining protein MinC [Buchnera aphidicola]